MANLPVPNPRTAVAGEYETAAYFNALRDAINFLTNPPVATVYQATPTTLAANSWTAVAMDSTLVDTYGGHSNTSNNTRYVAQVNGLYLVAGSVSIATNASSSRAVRIAKNGTAAQGTQMMVPPAGFPTSISTAPILVPMLIGDYVEVHAFPGAGALSTNVGTDGSGSELTVVFLHA